MKHELMRRVSMLLVVALVLAMLPMAVFAFGPGDKLYLQPNANWKIDNARFAAYFFGASGDTWADATLVEGEEDIYEVVIPEGDWTNVIFCRMNPIDSANNWNNKWSQSIDLPLGSDGNNLFTVNEDVLNSADGTWSYYEATVVEPSEQPSEPDVDTIDPEIPTDPSEPEPELTYPTEGTDPDGQHTYTIFFQNNWNWTDVRCYYWGSWNECEAFPGEPMEYFSNDGYYDIYSFVLSEDVAGFVISGIKDDGSNTRDKTPDILAFSHGTCYYMTWDNGNQVGSEDISVILPGIQPNEPTEPTEPETEPTMPEIEFMTIYFQNNWFWSDVRCYFWGSLCYCKDYPGEPMEYYGNDGNYDIYSFVVPADATGFVISGIKDDGSDTRDKTPDIVEGIYDGICYYMVWDDGNQAGSVDISVILPEIEPTEPTEPETQPTDPSLPETEPTYPELETTWPETNPTDPETEPTYPETDPTDPETEPTYPEIETTWPEPEPINCPGYYLVGTMDGNDYWFVDGDAADRFFAENEDCPGEYILDYTFVEGDEIKVVYFDGYGITAWYNDGGDNYVISPDKAGEAIVYFRPDGNADWSYYYFTVIPPAESSFVVAGVPGLCGDGSTGYGWDPTDLNNQLTDNGDGTYSKVYYDVAVGEYEFKVVECMPDGAMNWIGKNNSANNLLIEVTAVCDVTVTIDAVTKVITVTGSDVEEPGFEVEYIAAVGNGDGSWLNGVNWDPADESNRLTEIAPGVFQITYTDVECFDNYQLKFAADSTWANNWGGIYEGSGVVSAAEFNSNNNITIVVPYELADVTITLDLSNFDPFTNTGATFKIDVVESKTVDLVGPSEDYIKWQLTKGFDESFTITDLRMVTWVDSLDYQSVTFHVAVNGKNMELDCKCVYSAINANGASLSAAEIFGDEAAYLATYTITNIPVEVFDSEFSVYVTWTDLDGNVTTSETRTFTINSAL